jgi:hypothetical protein
MDFGHQDHMILLKYFLRGTQVVITQKFLTLHKIFLMKQKKNNYGNIGQLLEPYRELHSGNINGKIMESAI